MHHASSQIIYVPFCMYISIKALTTTIFDQNLFLKSLLCMHKSYFKYLNLVHDLRMLRKVN